MDPARKRDHDNTATRYRGRPYRGRLPSVAAALTPPAPQVSVEAVLAADPQVIIAGTSGARRPAWLERWKQWTALDAVRRQHLYFVDADLLHRPGPRFFDGIAQSSEALARARPAGR